MAVVAVRLRTSAARRSALRLSSLKHANIIQKDLGMHCLVRCGVAAATVVWLTAAALQAQSSLTRPYSTFIATPAGATVASGNTEQFSAVGMGDDPASWTTTGGTITESGLFVAGSMPGLYMVTATSGERSTTVAVTVAARTQSTA